MYEDQRPGAQVAGRLALLAAGCLLTAWAPADSGPTNSPPATNKASLVESVLKPVDRTKKPARFDSFTHRLDYIHENLYTDYNTRVERSDAYFGRVLVEHEQPAPSRFRLGLFAEVSKEDTTQFAFQPAFNAKIKLPNVRKRWNVFIDTYRPTDLPGKDPTEEKKAMRIGVGALTHIPHLSANAGLRLTWLPDAFLNLSWEPKWNWGEWLVLPSQTLFYETDNGFGEQTQLGFLRWFGAHKQWAVGAMTAGTWSQGTAGLAWEQTVKGGYVRELLEEKDRGHAVDRTDLARGTGLRYSMFGSDKNFTEHQFMLTHRRPVYKRWIYIEIDPGFKWCSEYNWRTDPFILVGMDFLFWGTPMK
jgi:hypothetical protein